MQKTQIRPKISFWLLFSHVKRPFAALAGCWHLMHIFHIPLSKNIGDLTTICLPLQQTQDHQGKLIANSSISRTKLSQIIHMQLPLLVFAVYRLSLVLADHAHMLFVHLFLVPTPPFVLSFYTILRK